MISPPKNIKKGLNVEEISDRLVILDEQDASNLTTTTTATTTTAITTTTTAASQLPQNKMRPLGLCKPKKI